MIFHGWKLNEFQKRFLNQPRGILAYVGGHPLAVVEIPVPTKYQLTDQDEEELKKRFTYHPPKDDQPERYGVLRKSALAHAMVIMTNVPPGRERAVALTELEQSTMWANAGIARNE